MGRHVETHSIQLTLQFVGLDPVHTIGQLRFDRPLTVHVAEQIELPTFPLALGRLRVGQNLIDPVKDPRTINIKRVERPGCHQMFKLAPVQHMGLEPAGDFEGIPKPPIGLALGYKVRHGSAAHALHGRQRVPNGADGYIRHLVVVTCRRFGGIELRNAEFDLGFVHFRRQQYDLLTLKLLLIDRQLVRVAHIQGHRSGKKLNRMVRLQPSCLIGDQRIGRRMSFVEAVTGKLGDGFKNPRRRSLGNVARLGPGDEKLFLGIHLGLDLFAHGPAQQIGVAQSIARQLLGHLHHLLLIDRDAVGLAQTLFEAFVQVIDLLEAMFTRDVARDVVHRTGPVKRDNRDDVFEAVGSQLTEYIAHARGFTLENPRCVAPRQHFEGFWVIERQCSQIHGNIAIFE